NNSELTLQVTRMKVSQGSTPRGKHIEDHYSDVLEEPETMARKICDRLRPILVRTANSRRNERSRHTQRNQAGGAFRVYDGTNNKVTASSQSGLKSGASVFRGGNERGSSRTLIIYMLSSGTSKFRRNPRASQALTAPREKCSAPVRRHAFALPSLPLARYHKASSTRCHIPNLS